MCCHRWTHSCTIFLITSPEMVLSWSQTSANFRRWLSLLYSVSFLKSSAAVEWASVTEYQKWSFQDFLKCTCIKNETTYILKFQLSHILKHLCHPITSEALCSGSNKVIFSAADSSNTITHSKVCAATAQLQKKRAQWTSEKNARLLKMRENSCLWEAIHAALPHQAKGALLHEAQRG